MSDAIPGVQLKVIGEQLCQFVGPLRTLQGEFPKLNTNFETLNMRLDKIEGAASTLNKSVDSFITSQDKLGMKIYWLNLILALATVSGTIIAFFALP